jgi:hypothetical protein
MIFHEKVRGLTIPKIFWIVRNCKVRRPDGEKKRYIDLAKKPTGAAHLRNLI